MFAATAATIGNGKCILESPSLDTLSSVRTQLYVYDILYLVCKYRGIITYVYSFYVDFLLLLKCSMIEYGV